MEPQRHPDSMAAGPPVVWSEEEKPTGFFFSLSHPSILHVYWNCGEFASLFLGRSLCQKMTELLKPEEKSR
jgi:hypothetical protein